MSEGIAWTGGDFESDIEEWRENNEKEKRRRFNESIKDFREKTWFRSIIFYEETPTPSGHYYSWQVGDSDNNYWIATRKSGKWSCGRTLGPQEIYVLEQFYVNKIT